MARLKPSDPIELRTGGTVGPYIMLPRERVADVTAALKAAGLFHWVHDISVALDGKSLVSTIDFGKNGDPVAAQAVLDDVNAKYVGADHVAG